MRSITWGCRQGFQPSRASSLKLAETLDADSIVVGSYMTDGTKIVAEAQMVDVPHLRMGQAVTAQGEMREMIAGLRLLGVEADPAARSAVFRGRRDLCGRR